MLEAAVYTEASRTIFCLGMGFLMETLLRPFERLLQRIHVLWPCGFRRHRSTDSGSCLNPQRLELSCTPDQELRYVDKVSGVCCAAQKPQPGTMPETETCQNPHMVYKAGINPRASKPKATSTQKAVKRLAAACGSRCVRVALSGAHP